jgi:hypothetical protein
MIFSGRNGVPAVERCERGIPNNVGARSEMVTAPAALQSDRLLTCHLTLGVQKIIANGLMQANSL